MSRNPTKLRRIFAVLAAALLTAGSAVAGDDAALDEARAVISEKFGMIEPEEVADVVIEALEREQFLILPHPTVHTYMQRKAGDYERWLNGMRRLQVRFLGAL